MCCRATVHRWPQTVAGPVPPPPPWSQWQLSAAVHPGRGWAITLAHSSACTHVEPQGPLREGPEAGARRKGDDGKGLSERPRARDGGAWSRRERGPSRWGLGGARSAAPGGQPDARLDSRLQRRNDTESLRPHPCPSPGLIGHSRNKENKYDGFASNLKPQSIFLEVSVLILKFSGCRMWADSCPVTWARGGRRRLPEPARSRRVSGGVTSSNRCWCWGAAV